MDTRFIDITSSFNNSMTELCLGRRNAFESDAYSEENCENNGPANDLDNEEEYTVLWTYPPISKRRVFVRHKAIPVDLHLIDKKDVNDQFETKYKSISVSSSRCNRIVQQLPQFENKKNCPDVSTNQKHYLKGRCRGIGKFEKESLNSEDSSYDFTENEKQNYLNVNKMDRNSINRPHISCPDNIIIVDDDGYFEKAVDEKLNRNRSTCFGNSSYRTENDMATKHQPSSQNTSSDIKADDSEDDSHYFEGCDVDEVILENNGDCSNDIEGFESSKRLTICSVNMSKECTNEPSLEVFQTEKCSPDGDQSYETGTIHCGTVRTVKESSQSEEIDNGLEEVIIDVKVICYESKEEDIELSETKGIKQEWRGSNTTNNSQNKLNVTKQEDEPAWHVTRCLPLASKFNTYRMLDVKSPDFKHKTRGITRFQENAPGIKNLSRNNGLFRCTVCLKNFPHLCRLRRHLFSHAEEKPPSCDKISPRRKKPKYKDSTKRSKVLRHIEFANMNKHDKQTKSLKDEVLLKRNQNSRHFSSSNAMSLRRYGRTICGLYSNNSVTYRNKNSNNGITTVKKINLRCCICNKKFSNTDVLMYHTNEHYGKGSNTCEICGQSFNRYCVLEQHKMKHSDIQCQACLKNFVSMYQYKNHICAI